jgi:hypothetical protein
VEPAAEDASGEMIEGVLQPPLQLAGELHVWRPFFISLQTLTANPGFVTALHAYNGP